MGEGRKPYPKHVQIRKGGFPTKQRRNSSLLDEAAKWILLAAEMACRQLKSKEQNEIWVEGESRDVWRLRRGAQLTARGLFTSVLPTVVRLCVQCSKPCICLLRMRPLFVSFCDTIAYFHAFCLCISICTYIGVLNSSSTCPLSLSQRLTPHERHFLLHLMNPIL